MKFHDTPNFRFSLRLALEYADYMDMCGICERDGLPLPPHYSMLESAIRKAQPELKKCRWIPDGASEVIGDTEVGHHGFRGANGSKGTLTGFAKMDKISYGDKHSPAIFDGAYQAGCMSLQQEYNVGPSSWSVSHIVHYPNNKRQMITIDDGKFTNWFDIEDAKKDK